MTHLNPQHPDGYYGENRVQRELKARRKRLRNLIALTIPRLSVEEVRELVAVLEPQLGPLVMM